MNREGPLAISGAVAPRHILPKDFLREHFHEERPGFRPDLECLNGTRGEPKASGNELKQHPQGDADNDQGKERLQK